MPRKRWRDLAPGKRKAIMLLGAAQVSLQAAALADLARRPPERVRGPKPVWAALSFVNWVGPISYLLWGRR
ncbi:PLDc N-terminal domain-containing protein [Allosalinactinospora lopnorensis]|uniref:PLDc N-terminal domain-containing protein n=1 Tax=Allosalinactinospora lopnorensis TaxID=1352348 RepID=UPI000623BC34|nr:PLDc N-terminal domain-containing protein [Allosalinactinospora lopnorensis]